jgi:uncharacterized protein YkwD
MMENFGIRFSAAGENIAYGQRSPSEVYERLDEFLRSQGGTF